MPAMKKATNYFENLTEMMSWYLKMVALLVSLHVSVYVWNREMEEERERSMFDVDFEVSRTSF